MKAAQRRAPSICSDVRVSGTCTTSTSAAALGLDRLAVFVDRSPVAELFDVLQEHQARPGGVCPAHHDPGLPTHAAIARGAALGLAVVAVGRSPEHTDRLAARGVDRVNLEHIGNIVRCLRVVGAVHRQRDRVVVYRDIWFPVCPGNPGAGATAAGEQVHHQLFLKWQAHAWLAVDELGFLLLCGHRESSPGILRIH
ncbi:MULTISPECIES: hypothetical protein [unclassified Pseudomonas]|uniref:hypothetical protein n=1 Tax=unclassified Pseudomonas TaxID=196821 RepID=UPI002114C0F3|nr:MULTISPECIES: hypothetical protein [unclassified Pseudomonas]